MLRRTESGFYELDKDVLAFLRGRCFSSYNEKNESDNLLGKEFQLASDSGFQSTVL